MRAAPPSTTTPARGRHGWTACPDAGIRYRYINMQVSPFKSLFIPVYRRGLQIDRATGVNPGLHAQLADQRQALLDSLEGSAAIHALFADKPKLDRPRFLAKTLDLLLELLDTQADNPAKLPLWIRIYQQLQYDFSHPQIVALVHFALQAAIPVIGPTGFARGALFLDTATAAAERIRLRYAVNNARSELTDYIFDSPEIRQLADAGESLADLAAIKAAFADCLDDWSRSPPDDSVALECQFIALFLGHLVLPHPAPARFWELALLKFDRWLHLKAARRADHALSQCLETLLAGAYRFEFLHRVGPRLLPAYQRLGNAVAAWLPVLLMLRAHQQGQLWRRVVEEVDAPAWREALGENLAALHATNREVVEAIRPDWERYQLDWLTDSLDSLAMFPGAADLAEQLLTDTAESRRRFCTLFTEGLTDPRGASKIQQLLETVSREAMHAVALTDNLVLAKDVFRLRLVRQSDIPGDWVIWKKFREISLALQRFELSSPATRGRAEPLHALYASLDYLVPDCTRCLPDWFGGEAPVAELESPAQREQALLLLRLLAVVRAFRRSRQAVLALRAWQAANLDAENAGWSEPERLLQRLLVSLQASQPEHICVATLVAWVRELPALALARQLARSANEVASAAALETARACPEFVAKVGKKGIQAAATDNRYLLIKAAQVAVQPLEDPRGQLLWWWNIAVVPYLVNINPPAYQVNLRALLALLREKLPAPTFALASSLIRGVYQESLGIVPLEDRGSRPTPAFHEFSGLDSRGPLWTTLFQASRPGAAQHPVLAAAIPTLPLDPAIRRCLQNVLAALGEHGDEELAWGACQTLLADEIRVKGTLALEKQWRALLAALPGMMTAGYAGFWTETLSGGLGLLRQVGLGIRLEQLSGTLTGRLRERLARAELGGEFQDLLAGGRLEALLDCLAASLRGLPPGMAALHLGRYCLEVVCREAPLASSGWQLLWLELEAALVGELDAAENLGLQRWLRQLEGLTEHLPGMIPVVEQVFSAREPVLADTGPAERRWRQCLGGLLVSVATPGEAPLPGDYLAQRLFLASPVFAEETRESWQERFLVLSAAFAEVFSGELGRAAAQRQDTLLKNFQRLEALREAGQLRGVDLGYGLLDAAPGAPVRWQLDLWSRHVEGEGVVPAAQDLTLSRLLGWRLPETRLLEQLAEHHRVACQFQDRIRVVQRRWGGLGGAEIALSDWQTAELRLMIRLMLLRGMVAGVGGEAERPMDDWPFETLSLAFAELEAEQKMAVVASLHRLVAQLFGELPGFAGLGERLDRHLDRSMLSAELFGNGARLVRTLLERQPRPGDGDPLGRRLDGDLRTLVRHLGYCLGVGQGLEKLGDWYWARIGRHLPAAACQVEEGCLAGLPGLLQKHLPAAELAVLDQLINEIRQTISARRAQQVATVTHENG